MYVKLYSLSLIPAIISVILLRIKKKTKFNDMPIITQQVIIGAIFGIIAIINTEHGVNIQNKAMGNVRDAAPLIAGLVFGGPSGIIAGLIGGIERYIAVYWGVGEYTRIACSVSTIIAGFYAAYIRKYLFHNKMPLPFFGLITALILETFHMSMVIYTHISDSEVAFDILKILSMPMITATAFTVYITLLIIKTLFYKEERYFQNSRDISTRIQTYILTVMIVAFFATSLSTYIIQTNQSEKNVESILKFNISEIELDLNGSSNINKISKVLDKINVSNKRDNTDGYVVIFDNNKKILSGAVESIGKSMDDLGLIFNEDIIKPYQLFKCKIEGVNYYLIYDKYSDYYIFTYMPFDEAFVDRDNNYIINSYMEIFVYAFIFYILYVVINANVVEKINKVNDGLDKITNGDLNVIIDVNDTTEFESLSNDINKTVKSIKDLMEEEKKRIEKDLTFAKKIQSSSLPSYFPAFPKQTRFDIYATMDTAKEVGGDFYDFYFIGKDRLAFLIADVSGKGVPAAMFMMTAKTMIKNFATANLDIVDIANKANEELCNGNDAGMFVTAFLGILNISNGHIDYVNCGHNPPLIIRDGKASYLECKKDFVLAGMDDYKYEKQSLDLNAKDKLYLYTDGVTEATDATKTLYGEDRLLKLFNNDLKNQNIYDTLKNVKKDIDIFVKDAEQADDITMLEIIYNGGN